MQVMPLVMSQSSVLPLPRNNIFIEDVLPPNRTGFNHLQPKRVFAEGSKQRANNKDLILLTLTTVDTPSLVFA